MEAFELQYSKGRWLAPLEVIEVLYEALLRPPAKGQAGYITLSSHDSNVDVFCATKHSVLVKEPFAHTEEQAKTKLSAWLEKRDLSRCDEGSNTESPVDDPAAAKTASGMTAALDSSESSFAATEAEAVRCLRERGYIVAPPYASTSNLGSITPPPPYTLHLSSSQPVRSIAREADTPTTSTNKRKRGDDQTTARATSCPYTPIQRTDNVTAQTREASGGPEIGDSDADDDDDELVSAPQRKKARPDRTGSSHKPTTPLRRTKTKKGTLTSTISYEAAAELTGAAPETVDSPPTDAENDADVSDGDEGGRLAADEVDRAVQLDDGE